MKVLLCSMLILAAFSMNAQTDTVMMNKRFENEPGMQLYQLSSLMDYTSACNTSFITGILGAGCLAVALIPNLEQQSKFLFIMCGAIGISVSIGYHIASFNIIDNPTNIVPVKK